MIAGVFHQGSGLGNQLFRYITTRCLALDKGLDFGMINSENFKGKDFMQLDMGRPFDLASFAHFEEKKIVENGVDIRGYDPEINFVEDNTVIDGEFQDERYWGHRLNEIRGWLKVEPLDIPNDVCVVNFRGGEFTQYPELFLTEQYWEDAMRIMYTKYPGIRFEIHTDDMRMAEKMLPYLPVVQDIGLNWRSIRYAKHLILSNSSFAILPALLNENVKEVIAPRYHARRNIKVWSMPQNFYRKFTYI